MERKELEGRSDLFDLLLGSGAKCSFEGRLDRCHEPLGGGLVLSRSMHECAAPVGRIDGGHENPGIPELGDCRGDVALWKPRPDFDLGDRAVGVLDHVGQHDAVARRQ